jgi:hypothetical protein
MLLENWLSVFFVLFVSFVVNHLDYPCRHRNSNNYVAGA